ALLAVDLLAELLVGPLGVAGEAVEARLHGVAGLLQLLLEQPVLPLVLLAQRDDLLAQAVNGRGADGVAGPRAVARFPLPRPGRGGVGPVVEVRQGGVPHGQGPAWQGAGSGRPGGGGRGPTG